MGAGRKRLGPPLPLRRGEGTALSGWYQREGRQKKKGRAEAETAAWMDAVVWKEEEEAEKGQYCAFWVELSCTSCKYTCFFSTRKEGDGETLCNSNQRTD